MDEKITVREALNQAMFEEMKENPDVFILGEEVAQYQGAYKVTQGLLQAFGPDRVIDTPISEYGFTGLAVGAALRGLRPIVEFMSFNFSMQAIDHIVNSAAKTHYMSGGKLFCPIVFRGANSVAVQVGAQHSQCFANWYANCPGLKVVAPYDARSAKGLLKAAIRDLSPVVFLENELLYGQTFPKESLSDEPISLDKAQVLRAGTDLTLIGFSLMTKYCLEAAQALEEAEGISVEVVDLVSLRPIDKATLLCSLKKTHNIVIVDSGWPACGIASEIMALIDEEGFDELDAPPVRITGADVPMPYAKNLEQAAFPQVKKIIQTIKNLLN